MYNINIHYYSINPFSKKIISLSPIANSPLYKLKIFDVEEEKCFEMKLTLRIINSLDGISQININNSLYLCGSNDDTSNSIGSYLLKIDISTTPLLPMPQINSIFAHNSPSLLCYKGNNLIVIGGKHQTQCEMYEIPSKWKQLPPLPNERYKCSLVADEKHSTIYLFGGYTTTDSNDGVSSSNKGNNNNNNNQHENYNSILRLNLNSNNAWEVLFVKENDTFLARNSSVSFIFENSDMVYICGGKDNNDNDTEYIVEFDISKRNVKKSQLTLKKTACFDIEGCVDLNKMHFAFFDNNDFVHTISRNFKMSIIKFETFVPQQGIMSN